LAVRAVEAGRWCIGACMADLPRCLRERFALKFPAEELWEFPAGVSEEDAEVLWKFVGRLRQRCGEKGM
jgi:hypothetical protein